MSVNSEFSIFSIKCLIIDKYFHAIVNRNDRGLVVTDDFLSMMFHGFAVAHNQKPTVAWNEKAVLVIADIDSSQYLAVFVSSYIKANTVYLVGFPYFFIVVIIVYRTQPVWLEDSFVHNGIEFYIVITEPERFFLMYR